jgi:hypothetical protein
MKIIKRILTGLFLVFFLLLASSQTFYGYKSGDFSLAFEKSYANGYYNSYNSYDSYGTFYEVSCDNFNLCSNGASDYPNCTTCPAGYYYSNGSCLNNTNYNYNYNYTYTCPSGYYYSNGSCLPNQSQICSNGATNYPYCNNNVSYVYCNGVAYVAPYTCPVINPTANISITPNSIIAGNQAILSWSSGNANNCSITGSNASFSNLTGTQTIYPTASGNYTITCNATNGGTVTQSTYLTVTNPVCSNGTTNYPSCNACANGLTYINGTCQTIVNPPVVNIYASQNNVNTGTGVNLTWSASNASYCVANNNYLFSGNKNVTGTEWIANLQNTTTFNITCYNAQGQSANAATTVNVNTVQYTYCNGVQYAYGTVCPNLQTLNVTTSGANPTQSSATLSGYVNPNGLYPTTIWFEYGANPNYLNLSTTKVNTNTSGAYTGNLNNLECGKTYYYRAVGNNSNGTRHGETLSFFTNACNIVPVQETVKNNTYTITNLATNVGYNNAQLNGAWINNLNNNQVCQLYFNYGLSAYNLPSKTGAQNVYSNQSSAYASQAISSLKTNTNYYYQAVVNCNGQIQKGNVLSFKTLTNYVYQEKVKKTKIVKPITKVVQPKTSKAGCINCTEFNVSTKKTDTYNKIVQNTQNSVNNVSNVNLVENNQENSNIVVENNIENEALSLTIERMEPVLVSGQNANFKINYKNLSNQTLQNVDIRAILPEELTLISSEKGEIVENGKVVAINMPLLNPLEEGISLITVKVANDLQIGRQIVINGYGQYAISDNGNMFVNEVTTYVLSQVGTMSDIVQVENNSIQISTSTSVFTNLFDKYSNIFNLILLLAVLTVFIAVIRYVFSVIGRRS